MHTDYPPCETIRERLERDVRAMQMLLADPSTDDLVLERLPNGNHAWLRPSTDTVEPDDALYVVTDLGRRSVAMEALFGQPWPTVADWGVA